MTKNSLKPNSFSFIASFMLLGSFFYGTSWALAAAVTDYGQTTSLGTQVSALRAGFENYSTKRNFVKFDYEETDLLLRNLFAAHDAGNNERVISKEMLNIALSERLSRKQRSYVLIAMASSYFDKKSFRSTAELCSVLTNEIHAWSASSQMRKFASKCAFATLMAGLTWGNKMISERELSHLIAHPGFAEQVWADTPAKALFDTAAVVSVRNLNLASTAVQTNEEGKLLLAQLFAWGGNPQKTLLLLDQVQESLKERVLAGNSRALFLNALAKWSLARVSFDLGRQEAALSKFEDASEDLLDLLRQSSFAPTIDELLPGLFSRLTFDAVMAIEKAGFGVRALALLNRLRDGLNRLYQKKNSEGSQPDWIKQLMLDLETEAFQISSANLQFFTAQSIQAAENSFTESLAFMVKDAESLNTVSLDKASERSEKEHAVSLALLDQHKKLQAMAARYSVRTLSSVATERAVKNFVNAIEKEKTLDENERIFRLDLASRNLEMSDSIVWLNAGLELLDRVISNFLATLEDVNLLPAQSDQSLKFAANLSGEVLAHLQRAQKVEARIRAFLNEPARYRQKLFDLGRQLEDLQVGQMKTSSEEKELQDLIRSESEALRETFDLYNRAMEFEYEENYHARAIDLANEVYFTCGRLAKAALGQGLTTSKSLVPKPLNDSLTDALNEQVFLQLNLIKSLRDFALDTAKYRRHQSDERRAMQTELRNKETEVKSLVSNALVPLRSLVSGDRGSLVSTLKKAIASRKTRLQSSLLHAFGRGAISQQILNEKLESLEEIVRQAEAGLKTASEKGNIF